jgi:hypothetical protein
MNQCTINMNDILDDHSIQMDIMYNLKNIHVKSFTQLLLPITEPKKNQL